MGNVRDYRAFALSFLFCIAPALSGGVHQRLPTAIFSFDHHPDLPLTAYASGRLGIVQPTYARSYLYVAYRWLNGVPISSAEVEQINRYWTEKLVDRGPAPRSNALETYDALRGSLQIPWQAPRNKKNRRGTQYLAVDYIYYSKCADHAFATAAETLKARIDEFGIQSRETAEWVRGQDFVFENCFDASSGLIPPRAPADVHPLIHADREYQVAAALFYSARYEEAASAFRRISGNRESPWAAWGRYLAGRALLWEARTKGESTPLYQEKLAEAAAELRVASEGEGPQEVRDAASWLLARILMKTQPEEAAALLSSRLLSPIGVSTRAEELGLFTQLMDSWAEDSGALADLRQANELVDWIFTLQNEGEASTEHALARWRAEKSLTWLVATIAKIGPGHKAVAELLDAAEEVNNGPGAAMVAYHQARLLMSRGRREDARVALDALLPALAGLDSSRNRALSLRAELARDPEELLFYGRRHPAFISHVYWRAFHNYWNEQEYHSPWRLSPSARVQLEPLKGAARWGPETAAILNRAPLDVVAKMIDLDEQPEGLQTELLLAAWTRAALLERWDLVRALAPKVAEAAPSMREDLQALLAAAEPDSMQFFAVTALLKTPGVSATLRSGPIRIGPIYRADPQGLNWWWGSPVDAGRPEFLSAEQLEQAAQEWRRIDALGEGYLWLLRRATKAAERPGAADDAANILYRAVTALDSVDLRSGYQPYFDAREDRAKAVETLERRFPGWLGRMKAVEALATASLD